MPWFSWIQKAWVPDILFQKGAGMRLVQENIWILAPIQFCGCGQWSASHEIIAWTVRICSYIKIHMCPLFVSLLVYHTGLLLMGAQGGGRSYRLSGYTLSVTVNPFSPAAKQVTASNKRYTFHLPSGYFTLHLAFHCFLPRIAMISNNYLGVHDIWKL